MSKRGDDVSRGGRRQQKEMSVVELMFGRNLGNRLGVSVSAASW